MCKKNYKMKKSYLLFTAIITTVIITACSSARQSGVWVNTEKIQGKSFNKIFIIVMTANVEARAKLENDLAAAAVLKGYNAVKSIDVMPPTLSDPKSESKEQIAAKVKESGCDAVLVTSLLKKEESSRYIPGAGDYSMLPYYSWGGRYRSYYSHWYPTLYSPGYYTNENTYFMQSNLYDAASEEVMWSVQSKVFAPSSLDSFSKEYIYGLIKRLENENLLKK
jgi:hypothetical protein